MYHHHGTCAVGNGKEYARWMLTQLAAWARPPLFFYTKFGWHSISILMQRSVPHLNAEGTSFCLVCAVRWLVDKHRQKWRVKFSARKRIIRPSCPTRRTCGDVLQHPLLKRESTFSAKKVHPRFLYKYAINDTVYALQFLGRSPCLDTMFGLVSIVALLTKHYS